MAMIACKECKKEISNKAESCPHCGYKPYMPKFGFFEITIIVLIFLSIKSCVFDEDKPIKNPESKYTPKESAASACRLFIEQALNDPDNAQFEPRKSAYVEDAGNGIYKVIYPLRAKNGFNATVKTNFFCHMKFDGNNWNPIEVSEIK